MIVFWTVPHEVADDDQTSAIAEIPAQGFSKYQCVGLAGGFLITLSGVGFEFVFISVIAANQRDALTLRWFQIIPGILFVLGVYIVAYVAMELFRCFEFRADNDFLQRISRCGPICRRRVWRRCEISAAALRDTDVHFLGERFSRFELVLLNGDSIAILPPRPASALIPVEIAVNELINSNAAYHALGVHPLGAGVIAYEMPQGFRIKANPISPFMVPGQLYAVGTAFAIGDPLLSLGAIAVLRDQIQQGPWQPLFWLMMVGQMLTLTAAGVALRIWIQAIAQRCYEITIERSDVTVVEMRSGTIKTQQRRITEIRDVQCTVIVSSGEDKNKRPELLRLELVTDDKQPVEFLCGRPMKETHWILNRVRCGLNLPPDDSLIRPMDTQ